MFFIYSWLLTICDVDKNLQKKRWRQHKKVVPVRPYICGKIQDYANKNYKNHSCIHRCETASGRNERKRVGQWVHWDNAVLLWAERGGSPNVNQREVQDTGTSGNRTDHQIIRAIEKDKIDKLLPAPEAHSDELLDRADKQVTQLKAEVERLKQAGAPDVEDRRKLGQVVRLLENAFDQKNFKKAEKGTDYFVAPVYLEMLLYKVKEICS